MQLLEKYSLNGKIAVVTGSAQGLGKGYAKGIAEAGANVVCVDINFEGASQTVAEIKNDGFYAEAVKLNVGNAIEVADAMSSLAQRHGKIDILINNAGVEDISPYIDVTEKQFDKIVGVNLRGAFFTAQAASKIMKVQRAGKILNIGSLGSAIGLAESSVYCATKSGILGITRTMAIELAKYNIQVNAIGPGYFRTPMTEPFFQDPEHKRWIEERIPAGRVGTVEDLLGAVIFLCSAASDYITGQILYIDGGWLAS